MGSLVSVIIPVYKAEEYLSACVNSVLQQSLRDLEIILVDDGSPDGCPAICDEFARKDPRVAVIHKTNGGASSARNAGLDLATGKYLCFVDSDDLLPERALEALLLGMEKYVAQYAAGICMLGNTGRAKNPIKNEQMINLRDEPQTVLRYLTGAGSYSPYAKLYLTGIVQANHVRYDESMECGEDAFFIRNYLCGCATMVLIPEPVYIYNISNENSISRKGYERYSTYYLQVLGAAGKLCDAIGLQETEKQAFLTHCAIDGLRVSTNHYLKNFQEPAMQKKLIAKCLEQTQQWLWMDSDHAFWMASDLRRWWDDKKQLVFEGCQDRFFEAVSREYRRTKKQNALKGMVKKLLGRQKGTK